MARADYAHWNEEADRVWWAEEGRHEADPNREPRSWDDYEDEPEPDEDSEPAEAEAS